MLTIPEYSKKYGVSNSTIRRRIRAKQIKVKIDRGQYLLRDKPLDVPLWKTGMRTPKGKKKQ